MKELYVVLLWVAASYSVKGQINISEELLPPLGLPGRSSRATPVADSHVQGYGALVNRRLGVNPFIQKSGDEVIKQQSGEKPVTPGGIINQQSGVKPVGSHVQTPGGIVNQQSGVKPVVGSHFQGLGGLIHQQTGVQPVNANVQSPDGISSKSHDLNIERSHEHKPVGIINQDTEVNPDGSYHNVWESENGIKVQEEGTVKVSGDVEIHAVSGSIAYTDPDGTPVLLTYTADENGYQPHGDHLPTPPPIPQSVARALEYIAAHPYVEEEHKEGHNTTTSTDELPVVVVA